MPFMAMPGPPTIEEMPVPLVARVPLTIVRLGPIADTAVAVQSGAGTESVPEVRVMLDSAVTLPAPHCCGWVIALRVPDVRVRFDPIAVTVPADQSWAGIVAVSVVPVCAEMKIVWPSCVSQM